MYYRHRVELRRAAHKQVSGWCLSLHPWTTDKNNNDVDNEDDIYSMHKDASKSLDADNKGEMEFLISAFQ